MTRPVGTPHLLVAAVGELHRVAVLHHDADFDHVGCHRRPVDRVVPRGAAT